MSDWREGLMKALHSGNPDYMKAMLGQVPRDALAQAVPPIAALATASVSRQDWNQALVYFDQLIHVEEGNARWYAERAAAHLALGTVEAALADAVRATELDPGDSRGFVLRGDAHAAAGDREPALAAYTTASVLAPDDASLQRKISGLTAQASPPLPVITWDPALYADPALPDAIPAAMVDGLVRHLTRYGHHQSVRSAIERLSDPRWIAAWQTALSACAGSAVVFYGSELGVLPLLALAAGVRKVTIVAGQPLERRIASGIVEKNRLMQWRQSIGDGFATLSAEQRQASFESFNRDIDIITPEQLAGIDCDWLVFPGLDPSVFGTGLVAAVARCRDAGLVPRIGVLPARVDVRARGIQWCYPASPYDLDPVNDLRWSVQPEAIDLVPEGWRAMTEVVDVGSVDIAQFDISVASHRVAATRSGNLDAMLVWYRLDLGAIVLDTGDGLDCLKPTVHYIDAVAIEAGAPLEVRAAIEATRVRVDVTPPRERLRAARLPSWYIPMLLDRPRNDAYRAALGTLSADDVVLEIGAGCGLLSMMAADAGSRRVHGCEIDPRIARVGSAIVANNGYADAVTLINKDCRRLTLADDLPQRADIVLFEMFDCGLIGEGILHFLAYVREHLAVANARYLPMAARLRAMLIEARLDEIAGIDVNLLNPFCFTPSYMNVDAARLRHRPLSAPFDVFAFDFSQATPEPQETTIEIDVTASGTAGAVLFWFDLQLDETTWLSNAPGVKPAYHWGQAMQYLPEVHVTPPMHLSLVGRHQGSGLSFAWREGGVPQDAFSRLPRADPATWAQAMELEAQTQQLLQHCRSSPEEYARVADLTLRIAADPARHGVDPKVAQRFAGLFL